MIEVKVCYRLFDLEIMNFIETLLNYGADREFIPIDVIDMHITRKAFLIYALALAEIVELKTDMRYAGDFIELPEIFHPFTHIKLSPNWMDKYREFIF